MGRLAKGVDLSLDSFALDEPCSASPAIVGSWAQPGVAGDAFWTWLSAPGVASEVQEAREADLHLLQAVFNPVLSDRRMEGDRFVPPDASFSHVYKLRDLVKSEEAVQKERLEHFLGESFTEDNLGPLAQAGWAPSVKVTSNLTADVTKKDMSLCRPHNMADSQDQVAARKILCERSPVFDKTSEDGMRFRIYRDLSLEVRTMQKFDGPEHIGVVFANHVAAEVQTTGKLAALGLPADAKVVKVTEFVEQASAQRQQAQPIWHYFVLFETAAGDRLITELLPDGTSTWDKNPVGIQERACSAKVLRSADFPSQRAITMQELIGQHAEEGCQESNKRYTRSAYAWAFGSAGLPRSVVAVVQSAHADRTRQLADAESQQRQPFAMTWGSREQRSNERPQRRNENNVFRGLFAD